MADDLRARMAEAIDQRLNRIPGMIASPSVSDLLADAVLDVVRAELLSMDLAPVFHAEYERLAPSFGYSTRKASAVPWEDVPEPNRALMTATCAAVMCAVADQIAPERTTDG